MSRLVEGIAMSKIGRKPIPLYGAKVEINKDRLLISGSKGKFEYTLSDGLSAKLSDDGKFLAVTSEKDDRETRTRWGLDRALLANKIKGVEKGFEQGVKIVGLGYKAQVSGKKIVFTLGYSHKVEYMLPSEVTVEIDKSGQKLLFRSTDKFLLGNVCDVVRQFKKPEPYKGTGIMWENEVIVRKAGKTKGA